MCVLNDGSTIIPVGDLYTVFYVDVCCAFVRRTGAKPGVLESWLRGRVCQEAMQYGSLRLAHRNFEIGRIQICRFGCIFTAIRSLVLADDWVYSGMGWGLCKNFSSVFNISHGRPWRQVGEGLNLAPAMASSLICPEYRVEDGTKSPNWIVMLCFALLWFVC